MNLMKDVLSISTGCPLRSKNCNIKWKKLLFLRLGGGCLVNSILEIWQLEKKALWVKIDLKANKRKLSQREILTTEVIQDKCCHPNALDVLFSKRKIYDWEKKSLAPKFLTLTFLGEKLNEVISQVHKNARKAKKKLLAIAATVMGDRAIGRSRRSTKSFRSRAQIYRWIVIPIKITSVTHGQSL